MSSKEPVLGKVIRVELGPDNGTSIADLKAEIAKAWLKDNQAKENHDNDNS